MEDMVQIFTPYITIKGRKVYRKNGKMFAFWVPRDKVRDRS